MIELFSEAMGSEISVFNINAANTLVDNVVSSVSIAKSIHPAMRAKPHIMKIETGIPNWSTLPIFMGVFLSYDMPESIDQLISGMPMTQKNPTKANVQIAEIPFAHGAERKAFYGRDFTSNTDIVLKEYIESNTDSVLSIVTKPGEKRYMSCERRYGADCKYLRFSNNADYEMLECTCQVNNLKFDVVEQLMAFSHWTYQISRGYLMVVDLQGIISTDESGRKTLELTDPAIHCKDLTRFSRTNWGLEGMKTFFGRHVCNKFCHAMELEPTVL
ncbi:alpha-kinase family domain-containing protein [Ditylenchus destructor]|uniref:Alpha-kinase family domain-containing protein n=1 Tax=Ditylenchus destructor TaxID=166010 RepID=A0AAD4MNF8_9BILA|nr:alpha-kinase family domain-containing protein [Ditylenchus destructor]